MVIPAIPDGLKIIFKQICRYGRPGEIKTISYTTADQLCLRGFAERYNDSVWGANAPQPPTAVAAEPVLPIEIRTSSPKSFTIISNITNGAGLEKDYLLLKGMLESYGHKVRGEMFNAPTPTYAPADVNIFLEVVNPQHLRWAKKNWLIPNSEWWFPCWDNALPLFTKVLCKTQDGYSLWCKKVGTARCVYIGFEAVDYYDPSVEKELVFLHLAGKSETKNTAAVAAAWRRYELPYPLIVSAFKPEIVELVRGIKNVVQVDRFPDVANVLNKCRFHIMPSKNEGFGHALSEAASCKGVILTTDAPPMNTKPVDGRLLIPVASSVPRLMTKFYEVSPDKIATTVRLAASLSVDELNRIGNAARDKFLMERDGFRAAFKEFVYAGV